MKSIFRVNPFTYFLILIVLLCGYFNYFLVILVILFFHEMGHILVIKLFHKRIKSIDILPFGAIIKLDLETNISSFKLLLISLSGIMMQALLYVPFFYLDKCGLISRLTYNIFLTYNSLILLFNMIPMVPLDGSKAVASLFELVMPYKLSLKVINVVSLVVITLFIYFSDKTLSLVIIVGLLLKESIRLIRNHSYIFNNFLLERYLYGVEHKMVKRVRGIKDIYKNYYNFINNIRESDVLRAKFKPFN